MVASAFVKFTTKEGVSYEIPCHRHCDAFQIISQFFRSDDIDRTKTVEGFLNEHGKFLNRKEALEEAIKCDQILDINEIRCGQLFSEDVW